MCGISSQLSPVPDSSGKAAGRPALDSPQPAALPGSAEMLSGGPGACVRAGIHVMQADTFDLHSFQTLTGTTFMMLTEPHTPEAADVLRGL